MAWSNGKVVAERFKHNTRSNYIWQPTGAGDWFRWRMSNWGQYVDAGDTTYWAINGCCRGKCYAGSRVGATAGDTTEAGTGWANSSADGYTIRHSKYDDATKTWAIVDAANVTHGRIWFYHTAGRWTALCTWLSDSDEQVGDTFTVDTSAGYPRPCTWVAKPAGATKIKVQKQAEGSDTSFIQPMGADFINKNSVVDPDTAGSMMFDGEGGEVQDVILYNTLDNDPSTVSSHEFALWWAAVDGPFVSTPSAGGISHRGIKLATTAWYTQSGTDALAALSATAGTKTLCDYVVVDMMAASIYKETACTNLVGTTIGRWVFDAGGCIPDARITPTPANMDLYGFYTMQCRLPNTATRVHFEGDNTVRSLATTTISPVKTSCVRVWGGPNNVVYTVRNLNPDDEHNYFLNLLTTDDYPVVEASGSTWKIYSKRYYSAVTGTHLTATADVAFGTRFRIGLADVSVGIPLRTRR
jgi:hypothetical protein